MNFTFLIFSLLLGMRHGLDPDHLSIINGISFNHNERKGNNKWNGLYFSLGHGFTVTLIGVSIIFFSNQIDSNSFIFNMTEWIPIFILLLTGILGIYNLTNNKTSNHSHNKVIEFVSGKKYIPFKLFLTGLLFALVFDTTTQVAAWGLIDGKTNQYSNAIFIGLFFTFGMVITDTINGLFFSKIINTKNTGFNFMKILTILIIFSSLFFGISQLIKKIGIPFDLPNTVKQIWWGTIMTITIIGVVYNFIYQRKNKSFETIK